MGEQATVLIVDRDRVDAGGEDPEDPVVALGVAAGVAGASVTDVCADHAHGDVSEADAGADLLLEQDLAGHLDDGAAEGVVVRALDSVRGEHAGGCAVRGVVWAGERATDRRSVRLVDTREAEAQQQRAAAADPG